DEAVTIFGIGERHLEIIVDRLRTEFQVEARVSGPHIAYKETLTIPADGDGKYLKDTGGSTQYAHVRLRLQPGERGSGHVFEDDRLAAAIPPSFVSAAEHGIREALARGVLAGYPTEDVRIDL